MSQATPARLLATMCAVVAGIVIFAAAGFAAIGAAGSQAPTIQRGSPPVASTPLPPVSGAANVDVVIDPPNKHVSVISEQTNPTTGEREPVGVDENVPDDGQPSVTGTLLNKAISVSCGVEPNLCHEREIKVGK